MKCGLINQLTEAQPSCRCLQPVQKRLVSSVTIEVELAGDKDTWTPLLDARTGHPLVSDTLMCSPTVLVSVINPFSPTVFVHDCGKNESTKAFNAIQV